MKIFYPLIISILLCFTAKSQERAATSSAQEATAKIIKFYPNPATSIINFDFQKGYDKSYNFQIFNFLPKFLRNAITCSIGNIDHSSAGSDNRFNHLCKIFVISPAGILGIKFNVFNILFGIFHCLNSPFNYFFFC